MERSRTEWQADLNVPRVSHARMTLETYSQVQMNANKCLSFYFLVHEKCASFCKWRLCKDCSDLCAHRHYNRIVPVQKKREPRRLILPTAR